MREKTAAVATLNRTPNFRLKLAFAITMFACIIFALPARAMSTSPADFLTSVFGELVGEYQDLQQSPTSEQVRAVFTQKLSPHIDYLGLARWTLRDHWNSSEEIQRRKFLTALEKHVIKTYASALAFDKDSSLLLSDNIRRGKSLTQVPGTFTTANAGSTDVLFRLVGAPGEWRIFDVGVHGISVAKTLRADFAAIASRGGIDAVITALSTGNLQLVSRN